METECELCNTLLGVCKKMGGKSFCEKLLNDLADGKISSEDFEKRLHKKFGSKIDKEIEKEAID